MVEILTGNSAAIRRTVVREAGAARHHGGVIEGLPETPRTLLQYGPDGSKEGRRLCPQYAERREPLE